MLSLAFPLLLGQIPRQKLPLVLLEPSFLDALPDLGHHVQVEMDIMDAGEDRREDLVGIEEVVDVGAAEVLAGVAAAAGVNGVEVAPVVLVGQADSPPAGKEGGAPGVAGR